MNQSLSISTPVLSSDASVWFSAYALGWGYCAFALPIEVIRQELGAADASPKQVQMAFQLARMRVAKTIEAMEIPDDGERVLLNTLN